MNPEHTTILRAELDFSVIIPLAILGAIVAIIGHIRYSLRVRSNEKDLLSRGFPPKLAREVAILLADKRFDEATERLKKARDDTSTPTQSN